MKNNGTPIGNLSPRALANTISDPLWRHRFRYWADTERSFGIHLAVFCEPFLGYVLSGLKTVDSRFSNHRVAPYGQIGPGDVILIKASSGPVVGICGAERVWSYELDPVVMGDIQSRFGPLICADEEFWHSRAQRAFGTLILLEDVRTIAPIKIDKKDRRGWVTVRSRKPAGIVVVVAGRIGAGKTTVAKALAEHLRCKVASFGDYFRAMATNMGRNPEDRALLQELGSTHVDISALQVTRDLLHSVNWKVEDGSLVVDGVRHGEVLRAIEETVAPLPVFLVYIDRPENRKKSIGRQIGEQSLMLFDSHSTETQHDRLRRSATVIIAGDSQLKAVVGRVMEAIGDAL